MASLIRENCHSKGNPPSFFLHILLFLWPNSTVFMLLTSSFELFKPFH